MQKYALKNGEQLIGRVALFDTMKDLIVDGLSALTMAIIGYISIKYKKGWIDSFIIKVRKKK